MKFLYHVVLEGFPLEIRYLVQVSNFYLQQDFRFGSFSGDLVLFLMSNPSVYTCPMQKVEGMASTSPRSSSLMSVGWFLVLIRCLVGDLLHPLNAPNLDFPPYLEVRLVITRLGLVENSSFSPHLASSPLIHPPPLNLVVKSLGPRKTIFETLCPTFVLF